MFYLINIKCIFVIHIMIYLMKCEERDNLNIMIISDIENKAFEIPVDSALDYLQHSSRFRIHFGCIIKMNNQNISNGQLFLDYISKKHSEALSSGCAPQMILDLTSADKSISEATKSFSYNLGIPTITATDIEMIQPWDKMNAQQMMHFIQITPPSDSIPKIIHSLSRLQNMTNAAIIYDKTFQMSTHKKFLLRGLPIRHIFVEIGDIQNLRRQLTELQELDIINYFILGSLDTIKTVLESVENDNYHKKKFVWYAITQDEDSLKCDCANMMILFVQPIKANNGNQERTFDNKTFYKSLPQITASFYYQLTVKSIISLTSLFTETNEIKQSAYHNNKQYLNGVITIDNTWDLRTHFIRTQEEFTYGPIIFQTNNAGFMEFHMILKMVLSNNSQEGIVGYWNSKHMNLTTINQNILHRLIVKPIYKVVIVKQPPFVIEQTDENGNKNYSGFCIDLIHEVSEIVGFDYELYPAPDNKFGTMDEYGEWNGLIKEVLDKRADIGLSSVSVTSERENVVEFTVPFYDLVGMNILMKKPEQINYYFKFFTVMEKEVWFSVVTLYFITSMILWLFDRFTPSLGQESYLQPWNTDANREFTIKECLWYCMTSITTQGGGNVPNTMPGRLIAATWLLFGWILTASYTANLAASLTVSRLDTAINSLEDLSKQHGVQYAPIVGSSGMTYFQRMADIESKFQDIWKNISLSDNLSPSEKAALAVWEYPIGDKYSKMWRAMQGAGMPITLQDAVDRVLASKSSTEGFAYIGDGINIRYQVMLNCDLQIIGEEFCKLPFAITVQKGSHLKEKLNKAIRQLLHKRRFEQLKEKWWEENTQRKKCDQHDDLAEGISIFDIGGIFIVILSGSLLAYTTLFFEYCFPKLRSRKQSNFQKKYNYYLTKNKNEPWAITLPNRANNHSNM